jgi:hypothetical protein
MRRIAVDNNFFDLLLYRGTSEFLKRAIPQGLFFRISATNVIEMIRISDPDKRKQICAIARKIYERSRLPFLDSADRVMKHFWSSPHSKVNWNCDSSLKGFAQMIQRADVGSFQATVDKYISDRKEFDNALKIAAPKLEGKRAAAKTLKEFLETHADSDTEFDQAFPSLIGKRKMLFQQCPAFKVIWDAIFASLYLGGGPGQLDIYQLSYLYGAVDTLVTKDEKLIRRARQLREARGYRLDVQDSDDFLRSMGM